MATLDGHSLNPLLVVALIDPDTTGYSIGVNERSTALRRGFYYSATAVTDRNRLVGMGQLYVTNRAVFADRSTSCITEWSDVGRAIFTVSQTIVVTGEVDEQGGEFTLAFTPGAPDITSDVGGCRNMHHWADAYFEDAATLSAKVADATVTTQLERTREHADVRAAVYTGRCEPIGPRIVGGCDNRIHSSRLPEILDRLEAEDRWHPGLPSRANAINIAHEPASANS